MGTDNLFERIRNLSDKQFRCGSVIDPRSKYLVNVYEQGLPLPIASFFGDTAAEALARAVVYAETRNGDGAMSGRCDCGAPIGWDGNCPVCYCETCKQYRDGFGECDCDESAWQGSEGGSS